MAEDDQRPPHEGHRPPQEDEAFYDDGWTEEDEERYQARRQQELGRTRRRRRQGASFAVLVLLVMGIGLGAAGIFAGWWEWPFGDDPSSTSADGGQPCPTPTVTAAPVDQVTVRVLNATDTRGLAATVAAELQARGMTVLEIGNDEVDVAETAQVRHGPESVLQARTVAAQFPGVVVVDDARPGPDVELSIGAAFTVMVPPEEATAALAPAPADAPAGCVTPSPATPVDPAATPTG